MVFNRKSRFECLDIANHYFTKADIKEYIYHNNQDNFLITKNRKCQ